MINETELPEGVTRDPHCVPDLTLDTCHALCFYFERDGQEASIIAWKNSKPNIRPVEQGKRLRDLRPEDEALVFDKPVRLVGVEIYR